MARIEQIRGALLEEVILYLLSKSGYDILGDGEPGTRIGRAGRELQGRGCWHQLDAIAVSKYSTPFTYPVRLLVEAKCYAANRPVQINVIRGMLGWLADIQQNFFTERIHGEEVKVSRFNYAAAIFSTSGYSYSAQQYALAHQIFLIDYRHVPAMLPVVNALFLLTVEDFAAMQEDGGEVTLHRIRQAFRSYLQSQDVVFLEGVVSAEGRRKMQESMLPATRFISASYHGMIEGLYPVHLLAVNPISLQLIRSEREIPCRLHFDDEGTTWAFEPSQIRAGTPEFFRFEFQLPTGIAENLQFQREQWEDVADFKRRNLSFVDVAGMVEGEYQTFKLVLDREWLNRYVTRRRFREDLNV